MHSPEGFGIQKCGKSCLFKTEGTVGYSLRITYDYKILDSCKPNFNVSNVSSLILGRTY